MDTSCFGIIPLIWRDTHWEVLVIHNRNGLWWGFPKGHAEEGEDPRRAAERELHEETGLHVVHYLPYAPLHEEYTYEQDGQDIDKQVTYFMAEVEGILVPQIGEITAAEWLTLKDAETRMTYLEGQDLCRKAAALLATHADGKGVIR